MRKGGLGEEKGQGWRGGGEGVEDEEEGWRMRSRRRRRKRGKGWRMTGTRRPLLKSVVGQRGTRSNHPGTVI